MLRAIFRATALALAVRLALAVDLSLTDQLTLDTPSTGVSTTPSGRVFILYARVDGSKGPSVVEYVNGTTIPYPNADWNSWTHGQGQDVATHFVNINSQRIGPDGCMYIIDTGTPGFGEPVIPNGVKVIQVDLSINTVSRVYHLDNATYPNSFLDDIRFNGPTAYLTDAGVPGIIVLDRASGEARRVLNNTVSTLSDMPISAEGKFLRNATGSPVYIYTDQMEVSPDGKYFYYQTPSGRMFRIETRYLNDTSLSATQLDSYTEPFAHTPSTGGTAIDADGNIYNSDTDWQRIIKISPNGTMSILVDDPRLLWVDAMWVDGQNRLWMPAAQLNRGIGFNNGTDALQKPFHIYTVDIGVGPPTLDHA
jgi:hypothetical protein